MTGRTTVNVSYPLIDETGAVQGAVFAAVDLTWLTQLPALAWLPEGSTLTISDRQGRVRVRVPEPAKWVGEIAWEKGVVDRIAALGEGSAETAGPDGITRVVGFTPLPSANGGERAYLAIALAHEPGLAAPDGAFARNLIVLGLIATLALVAARVIGDRVILRHTRALRGAPTPPPIGPQRVPEGSTSSDRAEARSRPERRGGDRRRNPRQPVSWPVRVWVHAGWAAVGRVVDASITGMRIVVAGTGPSHDLTVAR